MLGKYLIPDLFFDTIYEIDAKQLKKDGIKGLILDIDNTLVTYDDPEPTESVMKWFSEMEAEGIKISFVSNNDEERVKAFNRKLGYFATAKSGKPGGKNIKKAMEYMGTDKTNTLLIGDQLFTDVMAGKLQGMRCYLVLPIKDKKTLFFRAKRFLEKPYLRKYKKLHGAKK